MHSFGKDRFKNIWNFHKQGKAAVDMKDGIDHSKNKISINRQGGGDEKVFPSIEESQKIFRFQFLQIKQM